MQILDYWGGPRFRGLRLLGGVWGLGFWGVLGGLGVWSLGFSIGLGCQI